MAHGNVGIVVAAFLVWCSFVTGAESPVTPPDPSPQQDVTPEVLPGTPSPVVETLQPRALLGVSVDDVTDVSARQWGLVVRQGAMITSLVRGSPADRAGLPIGGVIVSVDGQRIDSSRDLVRAIAAAQPEQKIELRYYEGNRLFRKSVQLVPTLRPPTAKPVPSSPRAQPPQLRWENNRRPLLDGIGRLLDEFDPQAGGGSLVPPQTPANGSDTVQALQRQVEQLERQVRELQQKVSELERRLESPAR
jgi:hypothetical protein